MNTQNRNDAVNLSYTYFSVGKNSRVLKRAAYSYVMFTCCCFEMKAYEGPCFIFSFCFDKM